MKKMVFLSIIGISSYAFANNFVAVVPTEEMFYEIGDIKDNSGGSGGGSTDNTTQPWMEIDNSIDLTKLRPGVGDGYFLSFIKLDWNLGQKAFKGDPQGYAPYANSLENSDLVCTRTGVSCELESDGSIIPSNINVTFYDKGYSSGKYYFEVTTLNNPYAGFVGMISTDYIGHPDSVNYGIGASRVGYQMTGYNYIDGLTGYPGSVLYSTSGTSQTGTTLQVWIDYDERRIAVMELGKSKSDYQNFKDIQ